MAPRRKPEGAGPAPRGRRWTPGTGRAALVILAVVGLLGNAAPAAAQETEDAPNASDRTAAAGKADSLVTLRGTVVDVRTMEPAAAARVVAVREGRTAATVADGEGRFRLEGLPPGRTILRVTYLGWPPLEREVALPRGADVAVALQVGPEVVHLGELEIVVTDRPDGPLERFAHRVDRGRGEVIGREELEDWGGDLSWLVRRHVRAGPGAAGKLAYGLRGRLPRRSCPVRYYVNGRRAPWLTGVSLPAGAGPADYFHVSEISAIEIYNPPQVPASLGRGGVRDCSPVVVLWEKDYVEGR